MSATICEAHEGAAHEARIGPFRIDAAENAHGGELGQRIVAPRWSEWETVTDRSRDMQLERLQELVPYVRGDRL
jgi:hypothetical protein